MAINVVAVQNLGNEFDLGGIEAGKIHVKLGSGLTRDVNTGVVAVDPGFFAPDVNVQGLAWDAAANELTLTETDGTTHVVNLGTLAADKFLQSSSFDQVNSVLTLVMTDGSQYQIDLSDLIQVTTGVGVKGDGTTVSPLEFAAASLPVTDAGNVDQADMFVMATDPYPDGSRVSIGDAAEQIHNHLATSSYPALFTQFLSVDVQDAFGNHLYYAMP